MFVQGDICDRELVEPTLRRARLRRRRQLRGRVAQLPRRRRPDAVLPHERPRDADAARRVARGGRRALPPRVDVRGVRRPGARLGRRLHRGLAVSAADAVQRVEGGRRSRRPRLLRDVRAPGDDHELLEQLRRVPVPGEGDPALHDQRARRRAAAAVRVDGRTSASGSTSSTTARRSTSCCRTAARGRPTTSARRSRRRSRRSRISCSS